MIAVPLDALSDEALQGVLEEFVNREGTDYGEQELSLQQKSNRLYRQWQRGDVVLVFDPESETTTFMNREDWRLFSGGEG
ncbi:MAG: hypothetical protein RL336_1554 [Pseudomonadota bacterium]